jgi:TonB family protein
MTHGAEHYFAERARFERRVSVTTILVSLTLLTLLTLAEFGGARRFLDDPEHFGFEGPERYVRRIELEQYGSRSGDLDVPEGLQYVPRASKGGGQGGGHSRIQARGTDLGRGPLGAGGDESDLIARAMRRSSSVPLVQSEELIFEKLVRPRYPEEARARGIEGRFSILALIDTTGRVVQVQLQSGDPAGLLEIEAATAVRSCVIRPYRVAGVPREIVARFPFNFYLRD